MGNAAHYVSFLKCEKIVTRKDKYVPLNINNSFVLIHNPNMKSKMVQCQCLNKSFYDYMRFEMIKSNITLFGWWQNYTNCQGQA